MKEFSLIEKGNRSTGSSKRYLNMVCPGPVQVAQLVEHSPSKATNLGLIPGWGHDPAVGWGDTMFEKNGRLGMLARVFNTREHILTLHFTFMVCPDQSV